MKHNKKKLKTLHIITGLGDGGAESVLARLCLNSKSVDHYVISLLSEDKYSLILKSENINVYSLGMHINLGLFFRFIKLVFLIKKINPDVVQTWMYHADFFGSIAAKLAGHKKIFWGIRMSSLEKDKTSKLTRSIAKICAYLSGWLPEKIICCANKALTVHADLGYKKDKLKVIPNGYDLSIFKPDKFARQKYRDKLKINEGTFLIGMVGRFDSLKDHFNLLSAIKIISDSRREFKCLLVGKALTQDNEVIVEEIIRLKLQDIVVLCGQTSDVPSVMNALDLHVLSSCSEGFPNVVAEAMACGTPCVSTDVGDALAIIGDSESCCSPRDAKALAGVIIKMMDEKSVYPEVWRQRQISGIKRIAENYSIEAMVAAYENIWFESLKDND